jgi:hypothetical protein
MAPRKLFVFPFFLIMFVVFSGCVTTLQSYQPKNPEEMAIKELLLRWESTYNNHDVAGNLATWNDKAQIMYGPERKIASKKEYPNFLPERMKAVPSLKLGAPDIKVAGDKCEVSSTISVGNTSVPATFHLIKENNLWSIMGWKY